MSKFRKVNTGFWRDDKVIDTFSPEDRYFYLYLITNEKTTQIGVYKLSLKEAAFELGYDKDTVKKLIERFEKNYGLIKYNSETREIAIINWPDNQISTAGKPMADCLISESEKVTDKDLIGIVSKNIKSRKIKQFYDTYTIRVQGRGEGRARPWGEEEEEEKEEEKEKEVIPPAFSEEFLTDITHDVTDYDDAGKLSDDHKRARANLMLKAMLESDSKIENLEMLYKKSKPEIKHAITTFNDSQYAADNVSRNYKEHWRHFVNWFKKSIQR